MIQKKHFRLVSLGALVAMMIFIILPTVTKVVTAERAGTNMVEVCTADGSQWLATSAFEQNDSATHDEGPFPRHDHDGECPYCSLQAATFLSTSALTFATKPVSCLLPTLFYQAPKPLFAWAQSRSRAPPSAA